MIAFVVGGGAVLYKIRTAQNVSAVSSVQMGVAGASIGGAFSLIDHTGAPVSEQTYAGSYKLIYFGFTYCPAICPTELQKISRVMDSLGDKANNIQPLFVTLDPARDSVEVMREYVSLFHPKVVGLTGSAAQINDVLKAYRVYARKVWEDGASKASDDYTMDHSSYIYLMSPDDALMSIYRIADDAEYMVDDIVAKITQ